ncbi:MAG: hypothetical protein VXW87_02930 [Pseudomonadota bacterium]|nr:hypothetical protein [Pseudomonadota bacterium]
MDRMQKTFIILLTLCTQVHAINFSPEISVGVGLERQTDHAISYLMQNTLTQQRTSEDLHNNPGSSGKLELAMNNDLKHALSTLALTTNSAVVTFEVLNPINEKVKSGLRANFKQPFSTLGGRSMISSFESPKIESITQYQLNHVSYGLGIGIQKEKMVASASLHGVSSTSIESLTPSVSISSAIQLPFVKIELLASAAPTIFSEDTKDAPGEIWKTSSTISLLFNVN